MNSNSRESGLAFYNYHVKLVEAYRNDPSALEALVEQDKANLRKVEIISEVYGESIDILVESSKLYKLMSETFLNAHHMNSTLTDMRVNPESFKEDLDEMGMDIESAMRMTNTLLGALDSVYRSTAIYRNAATLAEEFGTSDLFENFRFLETEKAGDVS